MSKVLEWLPWVLIALLPGVFNVVVAYKQLDDRCRGLPFFEPWKNEGFWLWLLMQFVTPGIAFWFIANLIAQPEPSFSLAMWAIAFGLTFVSIFNAYIETGVFNFDIKSIYSILIGLAYALIAKRQTRKSADFWSKLHRELSTTNATIEYGLEFLESYASSDVALTIELRDTYLKRLAETQAKAIAEQVNDIPALLRVIIRRQDLPYVLEQFGCKQTLTEFFPRFKGGNVPPSP
ncbi:MAG: hypothetical protein IGR76_07925 [Synechococcales cyanobacterium T60_A2020_003]|nr:hypothetical protein [Synechococcales cyanobacterium T60_A2020_003]